MRRTKVTQIYRKTGNLRAVQLLLGHTKLESTVRYLGIEVDDALSIRSKSSSDPAEVRPCLAGPLPVIYKTFVGAHENRARRAESSPSATRTNDNIDAS